MTPGEFIEHLQKVRQTGPDRWLSRCPAHEDRSPSLSIREGDGGAILVHCFGGCEPAAIVEALGLRLADLFPDRGGHHRPAGRSRIPAGDVLAAVAFEIEVAALGVGALLRGDALPPGDIERLRLAYQRLTTAAREAKAYGR